MEDENLTRIMGLDYGLKRIGIAVSDPLHIFASSLTTLPNDNNLFKKLSGIISGKNIILIILGIPSDEEYSGTSIIKDVRLFKENLNNKFHLEVIEWDETYTSVIAQKKVIESVTKKKSRMNKGIIDMNSAAVILQEYLDSLK
jgi:putative holliday junction resolvase